MAKKEMDRRRFLAGSALGLAAAPLLAGNAVAGDRGSAEETSDQEPRIRRYNTLGRTGLEVSDISLGMAREDAVLRYALERGVNLYDTAEQYFQGQHEADIGRAFKDVRDKVVVITKHLHGFTHPISTQDVIDRFDASLERMGFDYVDVAMLHHLADPEVLENEELLRGYEELKKAGKYRFFGFSTHDPELVCEAAFASGLFDVMLFIYNSVQYPARSELITKAAEHGLGVMAMKTMAGRQQDRVKELVGERNTFSQAAIKWALTDPAVTSVLISMRTFEHVDEYLRASGQTLTAGDQEVLARYAAAVDNEYCRIGCTACLGSCPDRVAINDIMRCGMYYENYREEQMAMLEYARVEENRRAWQCRTCSGTCEAACPHRLSIRQRLLRYHDVLMA
jgi:predicted aldo/keto reductase-like oxidoreductase